MKHRVEAILLVGAPVESADLVYATGFRAPDPVVYLQHGDRRWLVVSDLEVGRASRVAVGAEVLTPGRLGLRGQRRRRLSDWALSVAARAGVRGVTVPGVFPLGVARRLERAGLRIRVAREALFPGRAVKTGGELGKIRESQEAAVIAMRSAIAAIADAAIDANGYLVANGRRLTSEIMRRHIARVLLDHDCIAREIIVAGGRQAADPHEGGCGPLRAHEAIVIDIFPEHTAHGYWGDLTRTVVRGTAPAALRRMYHAVRAAQTAALDRVKPGVACATVHRAACDEFAKRRYATELREGKPVGYIHGTGHGVGLAIHEAPSIGPVPTRLRRGNVITIEPGLYYPDVGGVRVEDLIVVTASGWRYLVPCEKRLEV